MKNKKVMTIVGLVGLGSFFLMCMLMSIFVCKSMISLSKKENNVVIYDEEQKSNKIKNVVEVSNYEEEKVLPSAKLKMTQYYNKCGHVVFEEFRVPNAVVNMTKEQAEKYYEGWIMQSFNSNEINLFREINSICKEHYIVRDVDGFISVYRSDENGNEVLYRATDILTKYLSRSDIDNLERGITVEGKNNLEQILEDYE